MTQQLTDLSGRRLQDLRISVTDRCNFRCRYCMPVEVFGANYTFLPHEQILSFEEVTRLAKVFVDSGVTKLRLTGGEPLLRKNLSFLVSQLASLDGVTDIAMTTNGVLLAKYAQELKDAGLQRVTVSLDSLDPDVFASMNGVGAKPEKVIAGIKAALSVDLGVKINMVVQKGVNESQVLPMAEAAREWGVSLRYIEYMDTGNETAWDHSQVVSAKEILEQLRTKYTLTPVTDQTMTETALRWNYSDSSSQVGIIASVTKPFCRGCGRVRLSASGELYTCLFATAGYDIKSPLRSGMSDEQLSQDITALWSQRDDRYSEERGQSTRAGKVEMSYIGG